MDFVHGYVSVFMAEPRFVHHAAHCAVTKYINKVMCCDPDLTKFCDVTAQVDDATSGGGNHQHRER